MKNRKIKEIVRDVEIVSQKTYNEPGLDNSLAGKITSVTVRAYK